MNLNNTIASKVKFRLITTSLIAGMFLLITSCSSESFTQQEQSKQSGEQTLTFTDEENGNEVHYEVNFNDGKISSLYKDNIKIPESESESEIENYEDLVYDKLNSINRDDDEFYGQHKPYFYQFDMDDFKDDMKEFQGKHFNFKLDQDKFSADMEKLKDELKDMDEIVIKIDKDKIKKDIDELKLHKFNFDFDEDEFNNNMKRITIELERNQDEHELNMDELEEEMERLEDEMGDLSEEMKELDKDMKNLEKFLGAAKSELVKDGLIKSTDEEFEFELNSDEMKVTEKKVSDELHSKYKDLYKEHFKKEFEDKIKIKI